MAPFISSFTKDDRYVDTSKNMVGCTSSTTTPSPYGFGSQQGALTTAKKLTSKSSENKKTNKKSVSFHESATFRYTIPLNEYTKEEINGCWFSKEEVEATRSDAKFAANLIDDGHLEQDTEEYCRRGLEYHTTLGSFRRSRLQNASCEAVLDEQDVQYDQYGAIVEPFLVAVAYKPISMAAMENARTIAQKDELGAMMVYL